MCWVTLDAHKIRLNVAIVYTVACRVPLRQEGVMSSTKTLGVRLTEYRSGL